MNKIPCASQNTEDTTLPADVCVFGRFGQLSPASLHSVDCRFDTGVKRWIHVSSIVIYLRKNFFLLRWNSCKQRSDSTTRCCFWSTVNKRATQFEHSFLIDKCSCKMVTTLPSDTFNFSAISCNFNLRSARTSLWSFLVYSWTSVEFSIICVCTTAFKVDVPLLNRCFRQNRVQIRLTKPLLCLNSIFPSENNASSTHEIQIFLLFWKFATVASLK